VMYILESVERRRSLLAKLLRDGAGPERKSDAETIDGQAETGYSDFGHGCFSSLLAALQKNGLQPHNAR
jgi:hypothetical protein